MAKKIKIKGVIIPNDYKWIYDWSEIESTCPNDVSNELDKAIREDLEVEINSGGGDVYSGSEIYTALKDYKGKVITKIVGIAASAASVIAMAGEKVLISPTAQLMIHNVSSSAHGDYRVFEHESEVLKNYNKSIANAYILKSGMDQDELLDLMNKETWLNAQQAKKLGFVDEIMFDDGNKLVASVNHSQIIPQEVINKLRNDLLSGSNKLFSIVKETKLNKEEDKTMDLKELKEKHPELYDQIKKEGYNEGVKAENDRIKEIEDLGVPGFEDLVDKAKFESKDTAEKLAMDIIKAQKNLGRDYLKNTMEDAKELDDVKGSEAPENKAEEVEKKEGASLIAKFANKKRGGNK